MGRAGVEPTLGLNYRGVTNHGAGGNLHPGNIRYYKDHELQLLETLIPQ